MKSISRWSDKFSEHTAKPHNNTGNHYQRNANTEITTYH